MDSGRPTLAFDLYGTLVDTRGVTGALRKLVGEQAGAFARRWRALQLEYTFRRALMRDYRTFDLCVAQSFDAVCLEHGVLPKRTVRRQLLELYTRLPAFADARPALAALGALALRRCVFSNGRALEVESLVTGAGLRRHFDALVSLEAARTYKPDPAAYAFFTREADTRGGEIWLVSGNPFDVLGALACGWKAAWVRREEDAVFDPWGVRPTATFADLEELAAFFAARERS